MRQTWRRDPATDICFIYTLSEPYLAALEAGKCSRSATTMEGIADFYHLPSIHLGVEVAKQVKEGKVIFKAPKPKDWKSEPMVFSEDGVHPFPETGHEIYQQVIVRSFAKMQGIGQPGPHALSTPFRADNWEKATLAPIQPSMVQGAFVKLDSKDEMAKRFTSRVPALWKASEPGASLEFTLDGTTAAAYDLVGPDCGEVKVKIDDQPEKTIARFDSYCVYHRLAKIPLLTDAKPGLHHVRVTLSDHAPDKAKILFEKDRADVAKNPAKYADNRWYLGGLLVIGEVK